MKSFFIDLTKCTACRGCQVACKQWKKLPAEETTNWGSHQNPKDISFITYKLVRMEEVEVKGKLNWLFFPEQCRHCVEPPCKMMADFEVEGAILRDEATGAVIFTEKTAQVDFETVKDACPYDIPRQCADSKVMSKCDMCLDRVQNGLLPSCVQVCPTGTMNFGEREDMLAMAKESLAKAKKKHPNAKLVDADEVNVVYLVAQDPALYYEYLAADAGPATMNRKQMFAKLAKPLKNMRG